jgi:hypothetical protein
VARSAQPGAGPPDDDDQGDDQRWPPWLSILFILVSSLALWGLIIWGVWWLIFSG